MSDLDWQTVTASEVKATTPTAEPTHGFFSTLWAHISHPDSSIRKTVSHDEDLEGSGSQLAGVGKSIGKPVVGKKKATTDATIASPALGFTFAADTTAVALPVAGKPTPRPNLLAPRLTDPSPMVLGPSASGPVPGFSPTAAAAGMQGVSTRTVLSVKLR